VTLGASDIGSCLNNGHGLRPSMIMERRRLFYAKADIPRRGGDVC